MASTSVEQLQLAADLRAQLAGWLAALRGYGPCSTSATDAELTVLAMESFARFLSTAAGRAYLAESRRFLPALAAALWTAIKFMCGRGQAPGASLLQHVTGARSLTQSGTQISRAVNRCESTAAPRSSCSGRLTRPPPAPLPPPLPRCCRRARQDPHRHRVVDRQGDRLEDHGDLQSHRRLPPAARRNRLRPLPAAAGRQLRPPCSTRAHSPPSLCTAQSQSPCNSGFYRRPSLSLFLLHRSGAVCKILPCNTCVLTLSHI